MNRKDFFKRLAAGVASIVIAKQLPAEETIEIRTLTKSRTLSSPFDPRDFPLRPRPHLVNLDDPNNLPLLRRITIDNRNHFSNSGAVNVCDHNGKLLTSVERGEIVLFTVFPKDFVFSPHLPGYPPPKKEQVWAWYRFPANTEVKCPVVIGI